MVQDGLTTKWGNLCESEESEVTCSFQKKKMRSDVCVERTNTLFCFIRKVGSFVGFAKYKVNFQFLKK